MTPRPTRPSGNPRDRRVSTFLAAIQFSNDGRPNKCGDFFAGQASGVHARAQFDIQPDWNRLRVTCCLAKRRTSHPRGTIRYRFIRQLHIISDTAY